MISEEAARTQILASIRPRPARSVSLRCAIERFAAEDYLARTPLPNFDNSAMDGYAVVAGSCSKGARLRVVGEQPAGLDRRLRVSAGEAVRVFTGAPLPTGADAVVMQEDVTRHGDEIVVNTAVEGGEFVRRRGCDVSEGQKIVSAGERIGVVKAAALAAQGFAEVRIGGEATAAILSTGDELVNPGEKLRPGQIYDSNSVLLEGLLEGCGAVVGSVERCRDEMDGCQAQP